MSDSGSQPSWPLILDTKGNCFICMETVEEAGSALRSLRFVLDHFHADVEQALQRFNNGFLQEKVDKSDVRVRLCNGCDGIANGLSDLAEGRDSILQEIREMEDAFGRRFQAAELQLALQRQLQEGVNLDIGSLLQNDLVDALRKELEKKCRVRISGEVASTNGKTPGGLGFGTVAVPCGAAAEVHGTGLRRFFVNVPRLRLIPYAVAGPSTSASAGFEFGRMTVPSKPPGRRFRCGSCGKQFRSKDYAISHWNRRHPSEGDGSGSGSAPAISVTERVSSSTED